MAYDTRLWLDCPVSRATTTSTPVATTITKATEYHLANIPTIIPRNTVFDFPIAAYINTAGPILEQKTAKQRCLRRRERKTSGMKGETKQVTITTITWTRSDSDDDAAVQISAAQAGSGVYISLTPLTVRGKLATARIRGRGRWLRMCLSMVSGDDASGILLGDPSTRTMTAPIQDHFEATMLMDLLGYQVGRMPDESATWIPWHKASAWDTDKALVPLATSATPPPDCQYINPSQLLQGTVYPYPSVGGVPIQHACVTGNLSQQREHKQNALLEPMIPQLMFHESAHLLKVDLVLQFVQPHRRWVFLFGWAGRTAYSSTGLFAGLVDGFINPGTANLFDGTFSCCVPACFQHPMGTGTDVQGSPEHSDTLSRCVSGPDDAGELESGARRFLCGLRLPSSPVAPAVAQGAMHSLIKLRPHPLQCLVLVGPKNTPNTILQGTNLHMSSLSTTRYRVRGIADSISDEQAGIRFRPYTLRAWKIGLNIRETLPLHRPAFAYVTPSYGIDPYSSSSSPSSFSSDQQKAPSASSYHTAPPLHRSNTREAPDPDFPPITTMFDVVNGRRIAIQNTQVSRLNCPSHAVPQEGTMSHMVPMINVDVFPVTVGDELGSLRGFGGSRKTERSKTESTSKDNTEFGPRGGSAGYGGYGGGLGGY
ncbi:hypothetical protein BDQ94DRAFT_158147 [Aspergillus welwitschiae]|uniref:Uncharacterized protein n=1 Tax=Aspergillus welwitschiae TaxID=1341132 RepID=A0A3F3QA55_9EURO|nr:hypothetical protein BDQ94DRAFT_158147 [Aspergillus welwitschiae]RDH35995.1 hypothetical protein BDQ94DRAFT_158147 [Aspergillus welwitschiae]